MLRGHGFADELAELLKRTQIGPGRLELLLPESDICADGYSASASAELGRLREIGVRLGIDDIGAGLGSLPLLGQLPIDTLKIAKTVIEDLSGNYRYAAVVRALVDLAHSLDLQVIAKGVSTAAQIAMLQALDCDAAEGTFFADNSTEFALP